jgi:hypothetical protein
VLDEVFWPLARTMTTVKESTAVKIANMEVRIDILQG